MIKILNLKLVILLEYQNIKRFLQKAIFQVGLKKFLLLKKLKALCCGHTLLVILKDLIVGTFYEKELQKANQNEFRFEKGIKRKGYKLYVKCKGYDSYFNSWLDKKDIV